MHKVLKWKALVTKAAKMIQPIVRGRVTRKILAWQKHDNWAAIRIQQAVRGLFGRKRFKKKMAVHFHYNIVIPAVCTIQRVALGMIDRKIARRLR